MSYKFYWGKARSEDSSTPTLIHPVWAHSLDVAAVADALFHARPLWLQRIAKSCGLEPDDARILVRWLAVIHDLGKFSRVFQSLVPKAWPMDDLGPCPTVSRSPRPRHDAIGRKIWESGVGKEATQLIWHNAYTFLNSLAIATFGHHGKPVDSGTASNVLVEDHIGEQCLNDAKAFLKDATTLLVPKTINSSPPESDIVQSAGQLLIAGFVNLADWIGSAEQWFPYHSNDISLAEYWEKRKSLATVATKEAGICEQAPPTRFDFKSLTGISSTPSPMQQWALNVTLPDGPMLVCLEDLTGGGKTEAAHILCARRIAQGHANGIYWAMPTMATANAMWQRQGSLITNMYGKNANPSIVLAHGQVRLSEDFLATVGKRERGYSIEKDDDTASMNCAQWIADDRRRAFLADIGVGTIDQALLGILPTRFFALRLLGLAGKVLVVDEAHDYDAYVTQEMLRLVQFQLGLGGDVIILSATFTATARTELVCMAEDILGIAPKQIAFERKVTRFKAADAAAYPLVTMVSCLGVSETPIKPSDRVARRVEIRIISSINDALDEITEAAQCNAACCYIRNTVDDAREAWEILRGRGLNPILFHARFVQGDRQNIETEVLKIFGKDTPDRRGKVLVATQLVEQSLDLDFDFLVSDLAPIAALIQRMGRFRRHPDRNRPQGLRPEMVLVSPKAVDDVPKDWLSSISHRMGTVYNDHGVLWRTTRALEDAGAVDTRVSADTGEQVRTLIATAYDQEGTVPKSLVNASFKSADKDKEFSSIAMSNMLTFSSGYDGECFEMTEDHAVQTRLSDPTTLVRIACLGNNGDLVPVPWINDEHTRAWALSEIRLASRLVSASAKPAKQYESAVEKLRQTWPRYERDIIVVVLTRNNEREQWEGELNVDDSKLTTIQYSAEQGVVLKKAKR